jgi:hypothetical protein
MTNSISHYGFMAINLRNRLKSHPENIAGNYNELLFYRCPEDSSTPAFIRMSLRNLKRTATSSRKPSFFELATGNMCIVTNWATFACGTINMGGMKLIGHHPIFDLTDNVMPSTMAMCVIFRAKEKRLGIMYAGSAYRVQALYDASFFES